MPHASGVLPPGEATDRRAGAKLLALEDARAIVPLSLTESTGDVAFCHCLAPDNPERARPA